jgi:hypothetical protein
MGARRTGATVRGQALRLRSFVRTYHPAFDADGFRAQANQRGLIGPAVHVDNCAVIAEASGAVDQQASDTVRTNMTEGDRRASMGLIPLPWRIVVRVDP